MINLIFVFVTAMLSGMWVLYFNNKNIIKYLLAFSGAFLIGISFMVLLPEIFETPLPYIGVFIIIGFVIQLILELISEGAEHGHTHKHSDTEKISPFLLLAGVSIHAFLEGMPLLSDSKIVNPLVLGIVIHNIPISLTLMSLFIHYGLSFKRALLFLSIFAAMTPFGALSGKYLITNISLPLDDLFTYTMAIVVGIFLHVSTTILFETDAEHKYNIRKFITILVGLIMAFGITLVE
jgi:zinc transporter ZupT